MKYKKTLVMTTLLAILVVLTVGCTKSKSSDPSEAPISDNFVKTGLPIVNNPINLKFVFNSQSMTQDLDKLPMFAELEKKTNIHINWDISRSGWEDKKAMILASGDMPDAFFGAGLQDSDISSNLSSFVPLEDYIAKYAPNITKMFEEQPITKKMSTFPDGHIYALPQIMPLRPSSNDTLFINKTWMDKLQLKVPTTLDEFFDVMMAFKTKDPNGNHIADEIPFNFANLSDARWFTARTLLGAWGVMYDMTFNYQVVQNDKVKYMPTMDEYKQLVMFLHKMYSNGLINKEVFTDDLSKFVALGKSPDHPILGSGIAWTPESVTGKWADEYVAIPPLRANKDITPLWGTNRSLVKYATNRFSISTKNKNIPETIRWIDQAYSQDMSVYLYYGSEGIGIKKEGDGTYNILQPTSKDYDQDLWKWFNAPADFAPVGVLPETEAKIKDPSGYYSNRVEMGNIYDKYLLPDKDIYPLAKFEKADQDELTLLKTDITKFVDHRFAQWVTVGGIEKEWDGYLAELDKMKVSRMEQIYQKGYDNYNATK
jgi:putative aldouronate transport system substrate-binding protein